MQNTHTSLTYINVGFFEISRYFYIFAQSVKYDFGTRKLRIRKSRYNG